MIPSLLGEIDTSAWDDPINWPNAFSIDAMEPHAPIPPEEPRQLLIDFNQE